MMVTTAIIAVVIVRTIMATAICTVMIRPREIEMIMVGVSDVNPKRPTTTTYINRTVKIGGPHETAVLPVIQHPSKVVIAHIQIIVIAIQCPFLPPKNVIHQITYTGNEIIVYFVHVIILFCTQVQFIGHLVRKKAGLFTHFAVAHCRTTNSCTHHSGKKYKYNPFHNPSFF
ncbi:hypothetical protein BACUNI_00407 [Bacteroides uniformis ATCC 8492]|uniref:Secreted protein n=1 Tax=Bacteroides uniformis (strain ATCC 8492 / DSM 6597 / CCUG 4942 / CIP 103695 / JCM 5828 / KCTC 5204 / NCTC 13054 / VPI 0061) TaxID=411479 RepID=A0ABC9NH17_BACUC|nr:hypothetical protein BACUNI_00407 [Bacteroides uniformis ATCC 8492]